MKFNKLFLIILILILSFSIASVSAADLNDEGANLTDNSNINLITSSNEISHGDNTLSLGEVNTPLNVTLEADDVVLYYRNGSGVEATLKDQYGNPLSGEKVYFTVSLGTYEITTNDSGVAFLPLGINPNTYIVDIAYYGSSNYNSAFNYCYAQILPVIYGDDLTLYYKNGSAYEATFVDGQGNPLINRDVQFNINGVFYTVNTDNNGVATLPIGLSPGEYIITAIHPDNNFMLSNRVTVYSNIIASDISLYYKNGTNYTVTVLDGQGKPAANQLVKMNVNGVFYDATTNEKGIASLPIGLYPNVYIITVSIASGLMHSNNITVLSTIVGNDLTLYYKNGSAYEATFLDGQGNPLKNRTVKMNVNGVFYEVGTNQKGVASLPIGLGPDVYIITSTNPVDGLMFSNTITVLSTIIADDFVIYSGKSSDYTVTLLDGQGNPLVNTEAILNIDGTIYDSYTNDEGVATFHLILDTGEYIATVTNTYDGYSEGHNIYVIKNIFDYGLYVFGYSMSSINFASLADLGVTDLLLSYGAFNYGVDVVQDFINRANNYGINVHIWMQCCYNDDWNYPVDKQGNICWDFINSLTEDAQYYASIPGVAGVHLDYVRFAGNAYNYPNAVLGITTLVQSITDGVKEINSNAAVSIALMPELSGAYYYGQDFDQLSAIVDYIIPMEYKGNYGKSSDWIREITAYYVSNSNGATIIPALQGYYSDDYLVVLPYDVYLNDVQNAIAGGASGFVTFRYGFGTLIDLEDVYS